MVKNYFLHRGREGVEGMGLGCGWGGHRSWEGERDGERQARKERKAGIEIDGDREEGEEGMRVGERKSQRERERALMWNLVGIIYFQAFIYISITSIPVFVWRALHRCRGVCVKIRGQLVRVILTFYHVRSRN